MRTSLLLLLVLNASVIACSRGKILDSSSQISFQVPNQLKAKSVGAFATMPVGRVACYGINIKGAGETTVGNACSPPTGIMGGFVSAGKLVSASVPKGNTITVELYLYLEPLGQNNPCPAFLPAITNDQLGNLYLVGSASNVVVNQDTVNVEMDATFPGVGQNIAEQLNMSTTCKTAATLTPSTTPFGISADVKLITGTNMRVLTRVGAAPKAAILTGSNIKVIVR